MTYTLTTKKPVSVLINEETTDFNQIALATICGTTITRQNARDILENYIDALDTLDNETWTQGTKKELIFSEDQNGVGNADGSSAKCYMIFKHFGQSDSPKIIQFTLENVTPSNLLTKVTQWSNQVFDTGLLLTEYLCTCAIFELG